MITNNRKSPTVRLTDEITVSPRLYRIFSNLAERMGYQVSEFIADAWSAELTACKEDRATSRRAAKAGMTRTEYLQHLSKRLQAEGVL